MKKVIPLLFLFICTQAYALWDSKEDQLRESILAAAEANKISAALPQIRAEEGDSAAKKKEKEMLALMRKSIEKSDGLSTEFLQSLQPELPKFYIEYLISGQREYVAALRDADTRAQAAAIRKMAIWGRYWDRYKSKIAPKL